MPTTMKVPQPGYFSYLLRIWQEERQGGACRASLEDVDTGEQRGFASLDDLLVFLNQQLEESQRAGTLQNQDIRNHQEVN